MRQDEVQDDGDDGGKADAFEADESEVNREMPQTDNQRHRDNNDAAFAAHIGIWREQRACAHRRNRAKKQQHDAAHDGRRHIAEEGGEFAGEGEDDGGNGGVTHDARVFRAGDGNRASDFGVGSNGRAAQAAGDGNGDAVPGEGAVQAGGFHEGFVADLADDGDIADVFNRGGERDRQQEKDGFQIEGGGGDGRGDEPVRLLHGAEIGQPQAISGDVTGDDAGEHGEQFGQAAGVEGDSNGRGERHARAHQRRAFGIKHRAAVAGQPHRHVGGRRGERKADDHDDRRDDYRREKAVNETGAEQADEQGEDEIDERNGDDAALRRRQPPMADGVDKRRDEGKGRAEENRHLSPGKELEAERANACAKQGDGGADAGQKRHQYQRAKGDEEHLDADEDFFEVLHGVLRKNAAALYA